MACSHLFKGKNHNTSELFLLPAVLLKIRTDERREGLCLSLSVGCSLNKSPDIFSGLKRDGTKCKKLWQDGEMECRQNPSLDLKSTCLHCPLKKKKMAGPSSQSKWNLGANRQIHLQSSFFQIDSVLNLRVLIITAIRIKHEDLGEDAQNMTQDNMRNGLNYQRWVMVPFVLLKHTQTLFTEMNSNSKGKLRRPSLPAPLSRKKILN